MHPKTRVEWDLLSDQEKAEMVAAVRLQLRKGEGLQTLVTKRLDKLRERDPDAAELVASGLMSGICGWVHRHYGYESAEIAVEGVTRALTGNKDLR